MRESSAEMRNDHTPGTEHFTDMLQNENARRLGPTVEGPRCEAVWAAPLRTVCCIFPAVTWKDARLAPLLVWDTPKLVIKTRLDAFSLKIHPIKYINII